MTRIFIACSMTLMVTILCALSGVFLLAVYVIEGAVKAVRETWAAWVAFVRLPWVM